MEDVNLPEIALKQWKLRKLISKAWIPLGISRDEAADILLWAIGPDATTLPPEKWPERFRQRLSIKSDEKTSVIKLLREVARLWQKKKSLIFMPN